MLVSQRIPIPTQPLPSKISTRPTSNLGYGTGDLRKLESHGEYAALGFGDREVGSPSAWRVGRPPAADTSGVRNISDLSMFSVPPLTNWKAMASTVRAVGPGMPASHRWCLYCKSDACFPATGGHAEEDAVVPSGNLLQGCANGSVLVVAALAIATWIGMG